MKEMLEILVPVNTNDGELITVDYHRKWDEKVIDITMKHYDDQVTVLAYRIADKLKLIKR